MAYQQYSGVFTNTQAAQAKGQDKWVSTVITEAGDPEFANTTLLLQANGSNGDTNNGFIDSSDNTHTITRNGNVTQGSFSPFSQDEGKWGNYFDGSGDYLTAASDVSFAFGTGDFTIEAWVYASSLKNAIIFTNSSGSGTANINFYTTSDGKLNANNLNTVRIFSTGAISAGSWNHVAITKESGTYKFWINGTLSGSHSSLGTDNLTDNQCFVGARPTPTDFWDGYIANLRVVKGTAVYTSAFTPSTEPLTAITNTSLLTCQSNRFVDNSSNAHSITVNGDPEVTPFSPFAIEGPYTPATHGGSGFFNGAGDRLTTTESLGNGDFTVELWAYTLNAGDDAYFETRNAGGSGSGLTFTAIDADTVRIYDSAARLTINGISYLNQWTHFAVVRSSGTIKIYVNGVEEGSVSNSTNYSDTSFTIGDSSIYGDTDAYIADFRLVKGTAVYTSNFTPPTAPLTAVSGTDLLCNFADAGIFDATRKNVLETVGDAQVDTAVKKYGTGSMKFDGTGDELVFPNSENFVFGTGDFTIEMWAYFNDANPTSYLFDLRPTSTNGAYPTIYVSSTSTLLYIANGATRISGPKLSGSQWYHIAVSRSGTSTKMFVDGTQVGSTYTDSTNYVSSTPKVGGGAFTQKHNGYIDDLRITKGVARYTANFTPPTEEFKTTGATEVII